MRKRESGLDLLRCLGLLLVVTFHSFLNNEYYFEPQTGVWMWLAGSVRWFSAACVGLFLMLTGYLKSGKTDLKSCYRGLLPVLVVYFLASAITIPVRHFAFGESKPLSTWIVTLVSFSALKYGWYVEMYVGLVLLIPFVNMVLERLDSPKKLLGLAGIMLALTALSGATQLIIWPGFWRSLYPFTYYILGAAVRRLQPKIRPWLGIAGAALMALLLGAATVLSTDGELSEAFTVEYADIWIVVIVVCLFVSLYRVKISPAVGRLLAWCAGGCYGGYLLSHLPDVWCYGRVPALRTPERYPVLFLVVTIPVFLVSMLGGKLLQLLADRLLTLTIKKK